MSCVLRYEVTRSADGFSVLIGLAKEALLMLDLPVSSMGKKQA